jgi:hypothetical protein
VSLHRLILLLSLAIILAAAPAFAQKTAAPASIKVQASGGFSGWAVPMPDFAAHITIRGEIVGASARLVYGDVSLTPLRVRISGNSTEMRCVIAVSNRATTLRLPPPSSYLVEPGAVMPEDDTSDSAAGTVQKFSVVVPPGGGAFWLPLQLYPLPADLRTSAVEVEVTAGDAVPVKASAAFNYLQRGKLYACLVEASPRGILPPTPVGTIVRRAVGTGQTLSGFNQQLQLISCAPSDLGPDYRVLRHFTFIAVSAQEWREMPSRAQTIISDAAAMGGRLVIFGAPGAVQVGERNIAPTAPMQLSLFGFGDVAVTSATLEAVQGQMAELMLQKLTWAHNLGLGFSSGDVGPNAVRDLLFRTALFNQGYSYAWMIGLADDESGRRSVNPAWAYDYLTRAGTLHPLDSQDLHWQSVSLDGVSRELVDMSNNKRESRPIHWIIDYNLRRYSAHSLSQAAVAFMLLVLAAAGACFARKCRYLVLAGAMLVLSAAAIGIYALRLDSYMPGSIKALQLSSTIGSADAEAAETRSVTYAYSAYSTDSKVTLPLYSALLTRISPLLDDTIQTSAASGSFTIDKLHLEPLLPTEFSATSVERSSPPVQSIVTPVSDGEELLELTCGKDSLRFVFFVDGTRVVYLGDIPAGARSTLVVPQSVMPASTDARPAMAVGRAALANLYSQLNDSTYSGTPAGLEPVGLANMGDLLVSEVLRQLVADGRGMTLVGLRAGASGIIFGKNTGSTPKVDLFVYRLK